MKQGERAEDLLKLRRMEWSIPQYLILSIGLYWTSTLRQNVRGPQPFPTFLTLTY